MDNAVFVTRFNNGERPDFGEDKVGGLDGNPLDVRGARVEELSHSLLPSQRLVAESSLARFCRRTGAEGYSWNAADRPKSAILRVFSSSAIP